jgi:alpha-1,3-mannosyl-glycoprotein beta-1,2-N-acetylglucosaminyltransferase
VEDFFHCFFHLQDGTNGEVKKKALSYSQITFMQHVDLEPVRTERPGELTAYYKIAKHYKWALDALFIKHNFDRVIILEDDMEIAPDFFDYFEAAAKLLDNDKYVTLYSDYTWQVTELISNLSSCVAVIFIVVLLKDDNGCFFLE